MGGEYHGFVASQLPEAVEETYSTSISYDTLKIGTGKKQGNASYSAMTRSREALGSSNNNMPAEDSVSEANERMNVRELFEKSASAMERLRYIHIHCKPLLST